MATGLAHPDRTAVRGNLDSIKFAQTDVTNKELMIIMGRSLSLMQDGVVTQNRELLAQGI